MASAQARTETLGSALIRTYQNNPVLNAERARQRGTDENVSIALSGYRPQVNAQFSPSLIAVRDLLIDGLARGTADLNAAEVNLAISQALYEQIIGVAPGQLIPAPPIDRLLPVTREQAVVVARRENPAVLGATFDIDVAQYAIRIAEGALYPTITAQGYLLNTQNTDVNLRHGEEQPGWLDWQSQHSDL